MARQTRPGSEQSQYDERVIQINRVAKVVKGGRRFSFTALVVVGDGNGKVGVGYGKAKEVPAAIQKGMEQARRGMKVIPMAGQTIVHQITGAHDGSCLDQASSARYRCHRRGAVRQILEAAGIKDALAKSLGSPTHLNVAKATMNGLLGQRRPDEVARLRGKKVEDITPPGLSPPTTQPRHCAAPSDAN
jgi:small subunit ribosomal protein S5